MFEFEFRAALISLDQNNKIFGTLPLIKRVDGPLQQIQRMPLIAFKSHSQVLGLRSPFLADMLVGLTTS